MGSTSIASCIEESGLGRCVLLPEGPSILSLFGEFSSIAKTTSETLLLS
jgi:hypothetical protein